MKKTTVTKALPWMLICVLAVQLQGNVLARNERNLPTAVPVLTEKEAEELVREQSEELMEERSRGAIFFRERFEFAASIQNSKNSFFGNVQETKNWKLNRKEGRKPYARILNSQMVVACDDPLEYYFVQPLIGHSMYSYSIACCASGKGTVSFSNSEQDNDEKQIFIDSPIPRTYIKTISNANLFETKIKPAISFRGNLSIESITIYQKRTRDEITVCYGEIKDISRVPDIEKSNYPDCYYTAKLAVRSIVDGLPAPKDIQLLIPAFLDNRIDPLSLIMKKGVWKLAIRPFASATPEEQEIEQVDEIDTFLYTPFILVSAVQQTAFPLGIGAIPVLEGKKYVSPYDSPINPPLREQFRKDSHDAIQNEKIKVEKILSQLDDRIETINEKYQSEWNAVQTRYEELTAKTIWAKERQSFFALPKQWSLIHTQIISDVNLDAIKELNAFFLSQGIQFIIQVVPDHRDIAALVLCPDFRKYGDQQSATVVKQLLDAGIEAEYLSDHVVEHAFDYERLFFYPNDNHPDEGMTDIMTTVIQKRLSRFGDVFPEDCSKDSFSVQIMDTGYGDNLKWPSGVDIGTHSPGSNVQTPYYFLNGNRIRSNPNSKILVFGNSFIQEPYDRDGYIGHLTKKILHTPTSMAMGGVSALTALPNIFLSDSQILKNKVVAILPISISILVNENSCFTNLKRLDSSLKDISNSNHLLNLPIKSDSRQIFPSDYDFEKSTYLNPYNTSLIVLSEENQSLSLTIPDDLTPSFLLLAVQPNNKSKTVIIVNDTSYVLESTASPNWQILKHDLSGEQKNISIKIDLSNGQDNSAALIGVLSLYN